MTNSNFTNTIVVSKSPEVVFNAVNNVRGWWSEDVEGNTDTVDDDFIVRFGTTRKNFKLIEAVSNKKVVWLVTDCFLPWNSDKTEWKGHKISFEILTMGNKTHIQFTHTGLVPASDCYKSCSNAWDQYLEGSLLNLIDTGVGHPTPKVV